MKKVLVSTLLTIAMLSSTSIVHAVGTQSLEEKQLDRKTSYESPRNFQVELMKYLKDNSVQTLTFEEIETNEAFQGLPKNDRNLRFYKEVADYRKKNPKFSIQKVVDHFDNKAAGDNVGGMGIYQSVYQEWTTLTTSEKLLVASNPSSAYLTSRTKDLAYALTQKHMGANDLGDRSDAFRHAVWNALMCRYISKSWAYMYATAHEDKSQAELQTIARDGIVESRHREMDLSNNQKGRDCWSVIKDSALWVSDNDLVNRVKAKLINWELTWLHYD